MRLSQGQFVRVIVYLLGMAAASIVLHEGAHIGAALAVGVPLAELKIGVYGINPSVTLPEWLAEGPRAIVYYAGGLGAGAVLLAFYLLYQVPRYRRSPSISGWAQGLFTAALAGMELASGYLEGRYHGAYVIGAMSLFSVTDVLSYGWALSAALMHSALCPRRRMKANGAAVPKQPAP